MQDYKEVETSRSVARAVKVRKDVLEKMAKKLEQKISVAPQGGLRVLKRKNAFQYYWRKKPQDANGIYIPKSEIDKASKLAQRDYDQHVLNIVKQELSLISSYESLLKNESIEAAIDHFNDGRKRLIKPSSIPDNIYIDLWQSEEYERFGFDDINEYYSLNGVRVRSKSEVIIANLLEHYGIPYKYEYPLNLDKSVTRPDFICLNVRTRQEYVWEHFGMMDDPEYANKNIKKISLYEQSGYHAGSNMILTFESSQVPLNSNIIKDKIEQYLI